MGKHKEVESIGELSETYQLPLGGEFNGLGGLKEIAEVREPGIEIPIKKAGSSNPARRNDPDYSPAVSNMLEGIVRGLGNIGKTVADFRMDVELYRASIKK